MACSKRKHDFLRLHCYTLCEECGQVFPPEHPEILKIEEAAAKQLEMRRKCLRPHKPGWWRNSPNSHSVGSQPMDKDL